ncbi:hypothetical protein GYA19_04540 [Candidatus Beckwithbacteria bacterium]|nr:hypothetical protein [Candidatus Beckwithbacteria bacterium]
MNFKPVIRLLFIFLLLLNLSFLLSSKTQAATTCTIDSDCTFTSSSDGKTYTGKCQNSTCMYASTTTCTIDSDCSKLNQGNVQYTCENGICVNSNFQYPNTPGGVSGYDYTANS